VEIDRDASVKTKIEMRKCLRPLSNQKKILFVTRLEKLKWREFSEVESDKKNTFHHKHRPYGMPVVFAFDTILLSLGFGLERQKVVSRDLETLERPRGSRLTRPSRLDTSLERRTYVINFHVSFSKYLFVRLRMIQYHTFTLYIQVSKGPRPNA